MNDLGFVNKRPVKEATRKGFSMIPGEISPIDQSSYAKTKIGPKTLDDAILDVGVLKKVNSSAANKKAILDAIAKGDLVKMREVSDFFYKTSGIYSRLCRHMAYFYRYDWMVVPHMKTWGDTGQEKLNKKIVKSFMEILFALDNMGLKKFFGKVALSVIRYGAYYGYKTVSKNGVIVQELPVNYCRSRFERNGRPVVEFNMKYFDDSFREATEREKMLMIFPKDFSKGYQLFKIGKLKSGKEDGWYLLDPSLAFKFNMNDEDFPPLISVIPGLIDLDEAQDLERKKMLQNLLKIIIQKLPLDKNGELIFDIDEARDIHNNAVGMLKRAIGVDVLTTFAEVEVADMSDKKSGVNAKDYLEKIERAVYNESGTAQNLFNTTGNLALEKSVLNDEATLYNLILQFEDFINDIILMYDKGNTKFYFKGQVLATTIYNYKEMSKLYKEQTQLGYSKMLPQIALGQSQSTILSTAMFENDILDLVNIFVPPMMSSTMSQSAAIAKTEVGKGGITEKKEAGRKEKPDDQKTEKTIANRESMAME